MTPPKFDPTINFGHLITFGGFVIFAVGSWYISDYRLTQVERSLERLSTLVIDNARIDERIKDQSRRLDALERR